MLADTGTHGVHANVAPFRMKTESNIMYFTPHLNKDCDIKSIPVVSLDDTSPNGEGSIRRYFCGEETGDMIGAHRLLFGEAGLMRGSKSRVRFSVAPQAITSS